MALANFTHGKDASVFANGLDLSAFMNKADFSRTCDTAEVSTFRAKYKAYIPGQMDSTISLEGFYSGGMDSLDDFLQQHVGADAIWTVVMTSDAVGAIGFAVETVQTTYEIGAEIGGAVAVSAEGQSRTPAEGARVLIPATEITATATGDSVDNAAQTDLGCALYLHVLERAATTASVEVEHSQDGTAWVSLASIPDVGAEQSAQRIVTSGAVHRYVRASWTVDDTITMHLSIARN